jgi:hypothetical protein
MPSFNKKGKIIFGVGSTSLPGTDFTNHYCCNLICALNKLECSVALCLIPCTYEMAKLTKRISKTIPSFNKKKEK